MVRFVIIFGQDKQFEKIRAFNQKSYMQSAVSVSQNYAKGCKHIVFIFG